MILTAVDNRNTALIIDLVQAKLLVEALRTLTSEQLVIASEAVNLHGFFTTGYDTAGATQSFTSVLGMLTDNLRRVVDQQSSTPDSAPPTPDGTPPIMPPPQGGEPTPKETVH